MFTFLLICGAERKEAIMATMEPPLDTLNRLIGGFQVSQAITSRPY
jgi:hypothetical protein